MFTASVPTDLQQRASGGQFGWDALILFIYLFLRIDIKTFIVFTGCKVCEEA